MRILKKEILMRIGKTALLYAIYLLVSLWSSFSIASETFSDNNVKGFWNDRLYSGVAFFYSLLILFSMLSVFVLHDKVYRARFIEVARETVGFKKRLVFVLRSKEAWIDIATLCVLPLIISPIAYNNFVNAFLFGIDPTLQFVIFIVIFALCSALLSIIAYLSTLNWWARPKESRRDAQKSQNAKSWIKQLLFSIFMYLLVAPLLSLVIPFLWSVVLTAELLIVTLTAIVVFGTLGYISIKYLRALRHRRRLMKKMKRAMKNGYCRLVWTKDIYRSVFKFKEGANICLERNGKKYYCKLITPLKKKHTVYFGEEGWVTVERHMVMAMHYRSDKYFFDAEDASKKILVVNPGALRIYATDKVHNRELQSGDRVMDYYVYRTDNFINGIEREYL